MLSDDDVTCPECGESPAYGVEAMHVYDGVIGWVCGNGHDWPRFPAGDRRHDWWLRNRHLRRVANDLLGDDDGGDDA